MLGNSTVTLKPNRGIGYFLFVPYINSDQCDQITTTPKVRQKHQQVENSKTQNRSLDKLNILIF